MKGTRLSRERRFDEALHAFFEAVQFDPTNFYLRTQIAATQEKLGLPLDALETYHGALELGQLSTNESRRRRKLGLLHARYRYAVVLGTSNNLAREWCKSEPAHRRREEARNEIRHALIPALLRKYSEHMQAIVPGWYGPIHDRKAAAALWLHQQLSLPPGASHENTVSLIFQVACKKEIDGLIEDYSHSVTDDTLEAPLTKSALRINQMAWAPLRLSWARKTAGYNADWPANPEVLEELIKKARTWHFREHRKNWLDHYDAACVYAVALFADGLNGESSERFADLACRELGDAVKGADSGSVAMERSWLLAEDPDLAQLRKNDRFLRFGREAYPHSTLDRYRFRDAPPIEIEMTAYDRRLLDGIASTMERTWSLRKTRPPSDIHDLIDWLRKEQEVWNWVHRVAESRARNWPDRDTLLQKTRLAADSTVANSADIPTAVPDFEEILNDEASWPDYDHIRTNIEQLDERLGLLSDFIEKGAELSPLDRSSQWMIAVRMVHLSGWKPLAGSTVQTLCTQYAAIWETLHDLLDPSRPDASSFEQALRRMDAPSPDLLPGHVQP
ncbi:hypothetical protein OHA61_25940 [Streptomyces sp. NBC_00885]|uniref:hypothetical protein n=1 Tax=Streptomyces sp. NBC_00885 TaxID=2975857 RepID=UPI00386444B1|nr:hypothetical protein OHA61_25940 [Streptomyces sp. NBC_00885]